MSGLHLRHKLPWDVFTKDTFKSSEQGIELPVGDECGKIHITSKNVEMQISRRKYLSDKVCDGSCNVSGTKRFYKREKTFEQYFGKCDLGLRNGVRFGTLNEDNPKHTHFLYKAVACIREFAETERKKASDPRMIKSNEEMVAIWKEKNFPVHWECYYGCNVVIDLMEVGDVDTILSFSDKKLLGVFSCQHGGQAVGNNFRFLLYHLWNIYFYTNLIMLFGLEDKPQNWGPMKPDCYFRGTISYDCDGRTCLHGGRKYLENDKYMKDLEGMKELCKMCFKFFYTFEMLWMETHNGESFDWYSVLW